MSASTHKLDKTIAAVRQFNRFYMRQVGALDERHLPSDLSLSEARILYEIAHRDSPTAAGIGQALFLDPGYLSRVLASFTRRGLIRKTPSSSDRREFTLGLTVNGRTLFRRLDASASREVGTMLTHVPASSRAKLVAAMWQIETILTPADSGENTIILREHGPGDIGWIIQRHGQIYTDEYGWSSHFETLVAEIAARFLRDFNPACERCWVAELNGANVGCVMLVRKTKTVAQLRLLLVESSARGHGIGARLVTECIEFARASGYRQMRLWTNDVLVSARKIYQAAGFMLVDEEEHSTFGKPLTSQTWELVL